MDGVAGHSLELNLKLYKFYNSLVLNGRVCLPNIISGWELLTPLVFTKFCLINPYKSPHIKQASGLPYL